MTAPAPAETQALAPRRFAGWNLYRDPEADQDEVKDLDLAERAGLAKPRDVRATVLSVIKDLLPSGSIQITGSAVTHVFAEIGSAASDGATNVPENEAASDRPVVRAEWTKAPKGNHGGTQAVVGFFLNKAAALLVLLRLRTPKALAVQVDVVQVFVLAQDGRLPAANPPADLAALLGPLAELVGAAVGAAMVPLVERIEAIEIRSAKALEAHRRTALAGPSAMEVPLCIGKGGASAQVLLPLRTFARLQLRIIHQEGNRKEFMRIRLEADQDLRARRGLQPNESWAMLPSSKLAETVSDISRMIRRAEKMLASSVKPMTQGDLFAPNVVSIRGTRRQEPGATPASKELEVARRLISDSVLRMGSSGHLSCAKFYVKLADGDVSRVPITAAQFHGLDPSWNTPGVYTAELWNAAEDGKMFLANTFTAAHGTPAPQHGAPGA